MMSYKSAYTSRIIQKFQRLLSVDHQMEPDGDGNFIIQLGGMTQTVSVVGDENAIGGPLKLALRTPVFIQLPGIKEERLAPMASFAPHFGLTALLPPVGKSEHWVLHTDVNVRRSKSDCMLRLMAGVSALQFYFASERQLWPGFTHEHFDFCNHVDGSNRLDIKRKLRAAVERGLMCTERFPEQAVDELKLPSKWPHRKLVQKLINRGRQLDMILGLKEGYVHLRIDLDSLHPVFKIGCGIVLKVYRPDEAAERSRQALHYNMESAAGGPGLPGLLGSWGTVGHEEDALAYHSFLPRFLYRPGLVSMLIEDAVQRAQWLDERASRKVPRASSAHVYIPKSKPVALQPGDAETLYIVNKLLKSTHKIWPEPLKVSGGFMERGKQTGLFYYGKVNPSRPVWNCVGLYQTQAVADKYFLYHRKLLPSEQVNHIWGVIPIAEAEETEVLLKKIFQWVDQSCTSRHALIHELPGWVLPRPGDAASQRYLRCALESWGQLQKVDWQLQARLLEDEKADLLDLPKRAETEFACAAEQPADYNCGAGFKEWWNTMADNSFLAAQIEATVLTWGQYQSCPAVHKCPRNCGMCLHLQDLAAILNSQGLPILNNHLAYVL